MSSQLPESFQSKLLEAMGAKALLDIEEIQSLWSGYGQILRVTLEGSPHSSVVLKHISPPTSANHPRGWNSDRSHQRKLHSYKVETHWYQNYSSRCDEHCRIPQLLHSEETDSTKFLILEDLDACGFPLRITSPDFTQIESCLRWLAEFHATFLYEKPIGLWESGTYWHLATRPDELEALTDLPLKKAAPLIDQKLRNSQYQTLVHGDAKLANFCFSPNGDVAAVDFQYVGGGCGMKDVAYFLGSCLHEDDLSSHAAPLLERYFDSLHQALQERHPQLDSTALITEWRDLFPYAWTDFHRFLKGWSPGHWKLNTYSEQMAQRVLEQL